MITKPPPQYIVLYLSVQGETNTVTRMDFAGIFTRTRMLMLMKVVRLVDTAVERLESKLNMFEIICYYLYT